MCLLLAAGRSALLAQQPDSAVLQRYFQAGQQALAQRRFAQAEAAFTKLTELDPTTAVPYANLGLTYFEERKFTQAIPAFQQSLKLDPSLANSRYFLAMSLSELGSYRQALPGLEEGFKQEADPKLKRLVGLHLERAFTGLHQDRQAVKLALELTQLYPNDPEILYQTSRLCANFAYLSLQKLGNIAPDSVWRHLAEGDLFETQGNYALAEREYRRVLALDPHMPGVHYRLGRALVRSNVTGAQSQALNEFEEELHLDPTNASAAYEAAEIYRKRGELGRAAQLLTSALEHYPDFQEAEMGLGQVLMLQGKPAMAVRHLQKAVALYPKDSASYYQLALAYRALGKAAEEQAALAQFRRLKAQDLNHQSALAGAAPQ